MKKIKNPYDLDISLFANDQVEIDNSSLAELMEFIKIVDTLEILKKNDPSYFTAEPSINRIALTPDFHRGAGIPIGTVLETSHCIWNQAPGKDLGCGCRMTTLDLTVEDFQKLDDKFDQTLRYIFFQGGRKAAMNAIQREAIFKYGLVGFYESIHNEGLWKFYNRSIEEKNLMRSHHLGQWPTNNVFDLLEDYLQKDRGMSYDSLIGIGGGNHFVELQRIDEVIDGATARAWGLKKDHLAILAHSGSVEIGHTVGGYFNEFSKKNWPTGLKHPENGFYPLRSKDENYYLSAMSNAANFAFANRLILTLMVIRALQECLQKDIEYSLVYDAPHNLVWNNGDGNYLHRKGACPAEGPETKDPEFPWPPSFSPRVYG